MSIYSGFISSFNNSLPTTNTDLMSGVVTGQGPVGTTSQGAWVSTSGTQTGYYYGYMYIGELLVQFTRGLSSSSMPYTTGTAIKIYYPIEFGGTGAYCVLANPLSISSNADYTVCVTGSDTRWFTVQTANGGGYIQYIAIGPR